MAEPVCLTSETNPVIAKLINTFTLTFTFVLATGICCVLIFHLFRFTICFVHYILILLIYNSILFINLIFSALVLLYKCV